MEHLGEIEKWEPDDLTIVVGAGARVDRIEDMLDDENQTAVMPEVPGGATIGGVIASGVSSLRRGRLYGTRERVLETTSVTGDGRVVRSGGRVVKNVTGYDLHRLAVGAFGALGVIVSVCLKLWPSSPHRSTVIIDSWDPASLARPLAVLQDNDSTRVFLSGSPDEIAAQAGRLDGELSDDHDWPADPVDLFRWSIRVPPAMMSNAIGRLPDSWKYLAVRGVGDIRASSNSADGASALRTSVESIGGHLVVVEAPDGSDRELDPWGAPPPGLDIQRRLIAEFDPARVINPGRLPGGI
jgi:glycolate oxidase FAD binding subunit